MKFWHALGIESVHLYTSHVAGHSHMSGTVIWECPANKKGL